MAPTEDRFAMPERRWDCRLGTPFDHGGMAHWVDVGHTAAAGHIWTCKLTIASPALCQTAISGPMVEGVCRTSGL